MIAILALLDALATRGLAPPVRDVAVATTRWVVEDPTADAVGLMGDLGAYPLLATALSFREAHDEGLRMYEDNLVKEGVGAGGAAVAAALAANISSELLAARTEHLLIAMQQDPAVASLGRSLSAQAEE
jgi:NaMN:DMB phosphoribosyltransferase